jgi:acetamidase/formamidase
MSNAQSSSLPFEISLFCAGPVTQARHLPVMACTIADKLRPSPPMINKKPSHTIHQTQHHFGWDNSIEPVHTTRSGETIWFNCLDAGCGHYHPGSTDADIAEMPPGNVNPVTGPVFVEGAMPGDALKVSIGEFKPSGFGWTAIIPGFGLLADQFQDPRLHLWKYDPAGRSPALFSSIAKVPVRPFTGTIGVAPEEPGTHSIIPPRNVGGNLDVRDLVTGSELYLPVKVEGALFSVGDTHAAQGDGEVCGTAIESAMDVELSFEVIKEAAPPAPMFSTPGSVSNHIDQDGYDVTTGVAPDLMEAARAAVSSMIDNLGRKHGMSAEDAYMLCSVCADLRISELVDAPNWVVSFYFPRSVLH